METMTAEFLRAQGATISQTISPAPATRTH
ncbi:hypothetical protein J2X01_001587 [Arthrobacter ginsengisoli]|uniref:Uncharacterized protein n=1 Tax=Arthrobacter ginsengisoli TaxID=1356565 RepID=A0ABU1UAS8_9MICC|nr:hypothetical protein [Arthrobacter ginsengisoli]